MVITHFRKVKQTKKEPEDIRLIKESCVAMKRTTRNSSGVSLTHYAGSGIRVPIVAMASEHPHYSTP
jgi:hypothetical protein